MKTQKKAVDFAKLFVQNNINDQVNAINPTLDLHLA